MVDDNWGNIISTITLDEKLLSSDATLGLENFSHIEVIFYMAQVNHEKIQRGARHPRNDSNLPKVGILAQRGKIRVNQLGLSRAKIVGVNGLNIKVKALDAVDKTPILDIKPYTKHFIPNSSDIKEPNWMNEIMKNYY